MELAFIEEKFNEIFRELEKEVMEVLTDQRLDKRQTNLRMKPLTSTKQILGNAIESIRMVHSLTEEEGDIHHSGKG